MQERITKKATKDNILEIIFLQMRQAQTKVLTLNEKELPQYGLLRSAKAAAPHTVNFRKTANGDQ